MSQDNQGEPIGQMTQSEAVQREQALFEKTFASKVPAGAFAKKPSGDYESLATQGMWLGWAEARALDESASGTQGGGESWTPVVDGIPQPYAGVIVLLETIAQCGCIAFYRDGTPTENRKLCLQFASELRQVSQAPAQPELEVSYGPMPESNGRSNFTAVLKRKGASMFDNANFAFARSEYPDRVRYDADRMRYLIGELTERPDLLAYDSDKHSGYVEPKRAASVHHLPFKWPNNCAQSIPRALRYLADHERPGGGEQDYNSAHLFQLADEMERAVELIGELGKRTDLLGHNGDKHSGCVAPERAAEQPARRTLNDSGLRLVHSACNNLALSGNGDAADFIRSQYGITHETEIPAAPQHHVDQGASAIDATQAKVGQSTGPVLAWMTEDGERVVTAATKEGIKRDGGASASAMLPYTVALGRIEADAG